jgi:hypothetical protein
MEENENYLSQRGQMISQKVIDVKTKRILGVECYKNGKWTWYCNEMNGNRLDRQEGDGRILANFPIEYVTFNENTMKKQKNT